MISPLILFAFCAVQDSPKNYSFFPIPIGHPVAQLREFDPRYGGPGDAIFREINLPPTLSVLRSAVAPAPVFSVKPVRPHRTGVIPHVVAAEERERVPSSESHDDSVVAEQHRAKPKIEDIPITLKTTNGDLATIVSSIMAQTGTNVILGGDSKIPLTLNIKNRRFIDALSDICMFTGLKYLKIGNEYVIAPDDKLKANYPDAYAAAHPTPVTPLTQPEEIEQAVYRTNYVDAKKLVDAVKVALPKVTFILGPEMGSVTIDSGVSAALTTGANNTNALNQGDSNKSVRTVVVQGSHEEVAAALALFKDLDARPSRVSVQVEIHDLSENAAKQLGAQWTFGQEVFTENLSGGIGLQDFSRSPLSFQASLQALENKGEDKLLAKPNLMVNDGQRGYVLVGDKISYPELTGYSSTGQPIYNNVTENVGLYVQLSAWIANDGRVTLDIYPQISTITGYTLIAGSQYPNISTRESQSVVTLESGKTYAMAGLMQQEDIKNKQGVPILDQLPILKEFFTFHSATRSRSEVLIMITPTIIKD